MATPAPRALKTSAGVALSLTVALAVGGCFANPLQEITDQIEESTAQQGAEELVEKITGGEIDIELGGELPKDFPESIQIVDGTIVSALSLPAGDDHGQGWTVGVQVTEPEQAAEQARQLLLSAGFEETLWNPAPGMTTGGFKTDSLGVTLGMMTDEEAGEGLVTYTVISLQDGA